MTSKKVTFEGKEVEIIKLEDVLVTPKHIGKEIVSELKDTFKGETVDFLSSIVNDWKDVRLNSSKIYLNAKNEILEAQMQNLESQKAALQEEVRVFLVSIQAKLSQIKCLEGMLTVYNEKYLTKLEEISAYEEMSILSDQQEEK